MIIKDILRYTDQRPFPYPTRKWKYYQEWNDVVFLHWKVDINHLKELIPKDIEIDTIDGSAWVSLVPFTMENVRVKNLPSFPPISNFDEINIRTYVRYNDKPGVYFLSIEVAKKLSAKISAVLSKMPYRYSKMNRDKYTFISENVVYEDKANIQYSIKSQLEKKNDLDYWLTERYAVFQDSGKIIIEYDVHHIEWPIFSIQLDRVSIDYDRFKLFFKGEPDLYHYSPGVQVIAWDGIKHKLK